MPDLDFFFALELSDEASFDVMLNQVAAAVFGYAGYTGDRLAEVAALPRAELAACAAAAGGCRVQFRAHAGELSIVVTSAGRPEWRITRALPQ